MPKKNQDLPSFPRLELFKFPTRVYAPVRVGSRMYWVAATEESTATGEEYYIVELNEELGIYPMSMTKSAILAEGYTVMVPDDIMFRMCGDYFDDPTFYFKEFCHEEHKVQDQTDLRDYERDPVTEDEFWYGTGMFDEEDDELESIFEERESLERSALIRHHLISNHCETDPLNYFPQRGVHGNGVIEAHIENLKSELPPAVVSESIGNGRDATRALAARLPLPPSATRKTIEVFVETGATNDNGFWITVIIDNFMSRYGASLSLRRVVVLYHVHGGNKSAISQFLKALLKALQRTFEWFKPKYFYALGDGNFYYMSQRQTNNFLANVHAAGLTLIGHREYGIFTNLSANQFQLQLELDEPKRGASFASKSAKSKRKSKEFFPYPDHPTFLVATMIPDVGAARPVIASDAVEKQMESEPLFKKHIEENTF